MRGEFLLLLLLTTHSEIPHEIIFVAEVARLREFSSFGMPEFWQIRLQEPHYFFVWGISVPIRNS